MSTIVKQPEAPLPLVAVSNELTKYPTGIDTFADGLAVQVNKNGAPADNFEVVSFAKAFSKPWSGDAHMVTYQLNGASVWPRCNKPSLSSIRAAGRDLVTQMIVQDWDLKVWTKDDKSTWTEQLWRQVKDFIDQASLIEPLIRGWTRFYLTRMGCRLVYVLTRPIPVDEAEAIHIAMVATLTRAGLAVDPACSDWTRFFRLPFVMRDGSPTWEEFFYEENFPENRLEPDGLPRAGRAKESVYGEIIPVTDPQPELAQAEALFETLSPSNRVVLTDWAKQAKKRLKGRPEYPCIFENAPLAVPGQRMDTIQEFVGRAVRLLLPTGQFGIPGTTPAHVYALFLKPGQQLEPDKDTPDWLAVIWKAVSTYWAKEQAKIEKQDRELETRVLEELGPRLPGQEPAQLEDMAEDGEKTDPNTTDLGNAKRLVAYHGADLKYVHGLGWMAFDRKCWSRDSSGETERRAKSVPVILRYEALLMRKKLKASPDDALLPYRIKLLERCACEAESSKAQKALLELARTEREVVARVEELDQDPWLFNVANGTFDFEKNEFREHRREDLLTKISPIVFDVHATCSTWLEFLNRIMGGNQALVGYLQRALGYSLTGKTTEQAIILLYGMGGNGKSTMIETVRYVMGSYAMQANFSSFLARKGEAIRNDIAAMRGMRFVSAAEPEAGRSFDEAVLKQLSGGEDLRARFLRQEEFQFVPQLKLWLSCNERPSIHGTTHSIWRRLKLVPFNVTIAEREQDKEFVAKLKAEAPGILNWMIEGCLAWKQNGLGEPHEVSAAVAEYRGEEDVLGRFLDEKCVNGGDQGITTGSLYSSYASWSEQNGEDPISHTMFSRKLTERGFQQVKRHGGVRTWQGLKLKQAGLQATNGTSSVDLGLKIIRGT